MAVKGLTYDMVMSEAQSNCSPRNHSTLTLMLDIEFYSIRLCVCVSEYKTKMTPIVSMLLLFTLR